MSSFICDLSATAEFRLITFLCFGVQAVSWPDGAYSET